jgi:single-strand DNA-binding protein
VLLAGFEASTLRSSGISPQGAPDDTRNIEKEHRMYGTPITIVGNVVDDVALKATDSGLSRVSFRVASTQRRKDRDSGQWIDGHKLFVNVTFWREFAENVAASVKKGDPVVVFGRIYSKQYVKDENSRVSYEIEPDSIGHDLARGVAKFDKRKRGFSGSVELDEDGLPMRAEDDSYELVDDSPASALLGGGGSENGAGDTTRRLLARPLLPTG